MAAHNSARLGGLLTGPTLLLTAVFLLPGIAPSYFGWVSGLVAIPVFSILVAYGTGQGTLYIRNGALLAIAAAIILNQVPSVLFSLTLVPLGYSFNKSAETSEIEWLTGARACLILGISWLVFWVAYGAVKGINPYMHLLELLDAGFAQTYTYYLTSADLPAENLIQLEQAVTELRALIPKILPGMLMCTVITTVWINLLGSVSLLKRIRPDQLPWKKYSQWRLPDKIVWLAIGAGGLLIIGKGSIGTVALAIVLVCSLLFFFQGLAVFIHLLDKWKVPLYLRIVIYAILVLQSYGLLLLTIVGLTDVWFDFRHRGEMNA